MLVGVWFPGLRRAGLALMLGVIIIIPFLYGHYRHSSRELSSFFSPSTNLYLEVDPVSEFRRDLDDVPEERIQDFRRAVQFWWNGESEDWRQAARAVTGKAAVGWTWNAGRSEADPLFLTAFHLRAPAVLEWYHRPRGESVANIRGYSVYRLDGPSSMSFFYTISGNLLVGSSTRNGLNGLLERLSDPETPSLADQSRFHRAIPTSLESSPLDSLFMYSDDPPVPAGDSPIRRGVELLYPELTRYREGSGHLRLLEDGMTIRGTSTTGEEEQTASATGDAVSSDQQRWFVPEQSFAWMERRLDNGDIYSTLIGESTKNGRPAIRRELTQLKQRFQTGNRETLFRHLGPEVTLGLVPSQPDANEAGPFTFFGAIPVSREEHRNELVSLLREWVRDLRQISRQQRREGRDVAVYGWEEVSGPNQTFYHMTFSERGDPEQQETKNGVYLGFQDDLLVISPQKYIFESASVRLPHYPSGIRPVPSEAEGRIFLRGDPLFQQLKRYGDDIKTFLVERTLRNRVRDRVRERRSSVLTDAWETRQERQIRNRLTNRGLEPGTASFDSAFRAELNNRRNQAVEQLYREEMNRYRTRQKQEMTELRDHIQNRINHFLQTQNIFSSIEITHKRDESLITWNINMEWTDETSR